MNEYVKNLNRIEFIVTMACTGRCKHCSEGDHVGYKDHIEADAAVRAIRDICKNYRIESLMTFGGEPLLYPETVCTIHRVAAEMGISQRDLITNGFFTKDPDRIQEVARNLKESGVSRILLSVDAFHQETIPLVPVQYFAECAVKAGLHIYLCPAWLVSEADNNPYNISTRKIIREFKKLQIPVGAGNVIFPSGNALKYLKEYFREDTDYRNPYEDDPRDIRTVSFEPNGDVLNGNIYQKGILDILEEYRPFSVE